MTTCEHERSEHETVYTDGRWRAWCSACGATREGPTDAVGTHSLAIGYSDAALVRTGTHVEGTENVATGTPLSTESEAFMQATIDAVRRTPSTRWQRIRRWFWGPT